MQNEVSYYNNGRLLVDQVFKLLQNPELIRKRLPIDALLLDYEMPEADGLQVVKEVKELYREYNLHRSGLPTLREPLYVFLSAHLDNKEFRDKCTREGVDVFCPKPIDIRSLRKVMTTISHL